MYYLSKAPILLEPSGVKPIFLVFKKKQANWPALMYPQYF
jgi:hypothetical protein